MVYMVYQSLSHARMQSIAAQSNCSEVCFIIDNNGYYTLRIFSPLQEMKSCVHATLAGIYVFYNQVSITTCLYLNGNPLSYQVNDQTVKLQINILDQDALLLNPKIDTTNLVFPYKDFWAAKTASSKLRLMIELTTVKCLQQLTANQVHLQDHKFEEVESYFYYTRYNKPNCYTGRMFAPKLGIKEDPVNGNSCIALYSMLYHSNQNLTSFKTIQNGGAKLQINCENKRFFLSAICTIEQSANL